MSRQGYVERVEAMLAHVQRRPDESRPQGARRVAIDAVYAARDAGGTMHDAGELAADAVLLMLARDGLPAEVE